MRPIDHYEALLHSRRKLQEWLRGLTSPQYTREFSFGHGSVRNTVNHLAGAEWLYGRAVRGEEFDRAKLPFTAATHPDSPSLAEVWRRLEPQTRGWLEVEKDWSRRLERVVDFPGGKKVRVVYTPEKVAFQMFYHEVHHRGQIMAMMSQMGIPVESLDFSRAAYEWHEFAEVSMCRTALVDFGTRYARAWSNGDPDALAAFYSESGSLTVNGGPPAVGRRAVADTARGFMEAYPAMLVTMEEIATRADATVFRWTFDGANTGPGGTGRRVHISGYEVWRLDADGLIAESQGHYDAAEWERQRRDGSDH
jgi:uncharacterized protein (TIGR02246 family)